MKEQDLRSVSTAVISVNLAVNLAYSSCNPKPKHHTMKKKQPSNIEFVSAASAYRGDDVKLCIWHYAVCTIDQSLERTT